MTVTLARPEENNPLSYDQLDGMSLIIDTELIRYKMLGVIFLLS